MAGYKRERHKPFKGGKGSNAISKRKGRIETKKTSQNTTKHNMSKTDRKNAVKVAQKLKRQELLNNTKIFSGLHGAPKIITVVPLTASIGNSLSLLFLKPFGVDISSHNTMMYRSEKFRSNMMFIACSRKLLDILSLASVSDFIVFAVDGSSVELDEWARQFLKCLCAQGIPNIIPVLVNSSSDITSKKLQLHKKEWTDFFKSQYSCQKVYDINDTNEFNELERIISQHQLKSIHWRDSHPYMISNDVNFVESGENVGTLVIKGHIRGSRAFDTKYPVNICGYGQFHIDKIESVINNKSVTRTCDVMMDMDQIPSENEQQIDHDHSLNSKRIEKLQSKRSIEGLSDYQAAWIVESENEDENEFSESSTYEELSTDSSFSISDQEDDENEEYTIQEDELMEYRKKLMKNPSEEEKNDKDFPDELDTPMDIDARARFKKYRGLKSFRHATWDANDEIPEEYSKICQFENIKLSEKKALEISDEESLFSVGEFINLHIGNVPLSVFQSINSSNNPLICFGLLKYEDMISILHFTISRSTTTWSAPVKSKEQFVMLYGYRKYIISPIFSEKSVHEKSLHKYLRFLHPERSGIVQHQQHAFGSVYGHVQFGSPPILLFKCEDHFPDDGSVTFCEEPLALVAFGTLNNIDPSKCIIKRVILTGYPFKIHRKTAVVRYMFFNPDDVKYFKHAHIYTKNGKQGRIISSLGTHGYMKCAFDRQLQQQDIVCMNLYRRIFPLWSFKEQTTSINDMNI